jgi:NitT/TauT family transport system substrate-binding protein
LLAYLKQHGLGDRVVQITEVPFPQMDGVLRAGTVDAIATAEPYLTQSLLSGSSKLLSHYFAEVSPRVIIAAYVAKADWLSANQDVANRFRVAIGEATRYLNANPTHTRTLVRQHIRITGEAARTMTLTTFADSFSGEELERMAGFLFDFKITASKVAASDLVAQ